MSSLPYPKNRALYLLEQGASHLSRAGLVRLCSDPELDFVVSIDRLGDWPVAIQEDYQGKRRRLLYLYDCHKVPLGNG